MYFWRAWFYDVARMFVIRSICIETCPSDGTKLLFHCVGFMSLSLAHETGVQLLCYDQRINSFSIHESLDGMSSFF